jgi:hypothetical protein
MRLSMTDELVETVAKAIYLGRYGADGGKWEAVETKDVWHGMARSAIAAIAPQPDAGAMAEAREIVNNIYGGFDSHVTPKGNMLIDAIATALTRREAAGFARGVSAVVEIAEKMRPAGGLGEGKE